MFVNNLNPILFSLGPVEIRWYGVAYVLGFFLTVWWLQWVRKKGELALSKEEVWDLVFYLMVGVLIGARLFMFVWRPHIYFPEPWRVLYLWEGGMSFHGGLVGTIVAAYWYCKKKKLDFFQVSDLVSIPTLFALGLGRVANFINAELVGRPFSGSWCVVNKRFDTVCRHPSTLYAAAKRFMVTGWLAVLYFRRGFSAGFIFFNYLFWENLGRIIVDFYRDYGTEGVIVGSLGQWMSGIICVIAGYYLVTKYRKDWGKLFKSSSG